MQTKVAARGQTKTRTTGGGAVFADTQIWLSRMSWFREDSGEVARPAPPITGRRSARRAGALAAVAAIVAAGIIYLGSLGLTDSLSSSAFFAHRWAVVLFALGFVLAGAALALFATPLVARLRIAAVFGAGAKAAVGQSHRRSLHDPQHLSAGEADISPQLRAVINTSADGIVVFDEAGAILDFSPAASRMFGYGAEEAIGRNVSTLMPEPHGAEPDRYLADHIATGNARMIGRNREVVARHKDGSAFPVDLAVSDISTTGRRLFLGVMRDISWRKEAEREKEEQFVAELARSNAELAQFAYVASHDLQEPLRMVASYLELISRRYQDKLDDEAKEFIAFAVDGATRMKRLIHDLLAYSRAGSSPLNIELTDTGDVVRSVLATLALAIDETRAIVEVGPLPRLRVDPLQLGRLFQNLIENAVKYRSADAPVIHVSATRTAGFWRFAVVDNGIGVDPRFRDKVFEIFKRLHSRDKYSGTGIGLAVSKLVVERHGGRIWVESGPDGVGSTFCFTIPDGEAA